MKITPAKYDSEYKWLREEARKDGARHRLNAIKKAVLSMFGQKKVREWNEMEERRIRLDGIPRIGMVLQALGMTLLLIVLVDDWDVTTTLSFSAVVAGEIIIINSLCHHGCEIRGERTK